MLEVHSVSIFALSKLCIGPLKAEVRAKPCNNLTIQGWCSSSTFLSVTSASSDIVHRVDPFIRSKDLLRCGFNQPWLGVLSTSILFLHLSSEQLSQLAMNNATQGNGNGDTTHMDVDKNKEQRRAINRSYYQRQKEKRNPSEPIADDVAMQKARKKQYNLNYRNKHLEIRNRQIANGEGSSQPRTGLSNMNVMNRISLGTLENHHTNSSSASLNGSQGWNKENMSPYHSKVLKENIHDSKKRPVLHERSLSDGCIHRNMVCDSDDEGFIASRIDNADEDFCFVFDDIEATIPLTEDIDIPHRTGDAHDDPYYLIYDSLPARHRVLKEQRSCVHCGAKKFQYEFPTLLDQLVPRDGVPRYLQLYFYDPNEELSHRLRWKNLDMEIVEILTGVLARNPYVRTFRSLADHGPLDNYSIRHPQFIQPHYACYDPLAYALFFPNGEPGWHPKIKRRGMTVNNDENDLHNIEEEDEGLRSTVSMRESEKFRTLFILCK
ncbi:hypothetical protein Tco_0964553, partial [Tanacetum coccineum]